MCNRCNHNPCLPTCPTIKYVACPPFPVPPGPQGPQGITGPPGPPGPAGPVVSSIIPYGCIIAPGETRYCVFASGSATTLERLSNYVMPRIGILDNLSVFVSFNDLSSTIITVRVATGVGAFAPTTQTITIPASGTGQFFSVGAPVPVIKGDRVSLEVSNSSFAGSELDLTGGLEVK